MIKNVFKVIVKTAQIGFLVANKFMPSGILQLAVLEGLKILVKRNNTDFDNKVLRSYIEKSKLPASDKVRMLTGL
tara:strand:+ start:453 stop:677 length:225 start_codon:yes stop_codon:yes gene_type:complete